jgi:hypothetical protein
MVKTLIAAAALAAFLPAHAELNVTSTSYTYGQSFDSLTTSTTAVAWTNDSTLAGWSLFNSAGAAIATYGADSGGSNAGSFRSFGTTGSGERALGSTASGGTYFGSPASGAVAGFMAVAFTNHSGVTLDGFTVGFAGEQWRNGGNTNAQSLSLEFGTGSGFTGVSNWSPVAAFVSPVVGATAAAVDGNSAGLVTGLGGSVALAWADGDTLWLRWVDRNDVGNDHGLAIDNLSFIVSSVPEPGTWALWLAGLGVLGFMAHRRA